METNNKASTSHAKSDSSEDDEHPENLSTEEICLKIKTFRNLCFGNKINVSNAFDIDMIGYFYSWLEKKKSSIFDDDDDDVTSFQEISDYLEATAKVYSYRVDNLTETTSRLVEKFKSMNYNKSSPKIDDNDELKLQKPKRHKLMLTTADKLRRRPSEIDNPYNPALINHKITSFNCNELFSTGRPSQHFESLYFDKSLAEEIKTSDDEKKEYDKNNETTEIDKSFFDDMMDVLSQGAICPDFEGFVAKRDRVDNSNDDELDGIEYRFDPDSCQSPTSSEDTVWDEPDNIELDSNSNDKDLTVLDGLLECIDNVDRDYSFFNPKLLANWKGPKAWKAQAMVKALKSCAPIERKDIISNLDENIDENNQQQNEVYAKSHKKRNKFKKDGFEIDWLEMDKINEILQNNIQGKEKILPRTLQKWDPLNHISDSQSVVVDVKYKFKFLQYTEIKPDWWTFKKTRKENICSTSSNSSQDINDCDKSIAETPQTIEIEDPKQLENSDNEEIYDEVAGLDVSGELNLEDEDDFGDIKTESRMDIAELKKEISDIIDEKCVETDPNSEWSSKLSFLNLLVHLRIDEREGLSIPIVFVGLLHLANERGLKLFQEHCTINDMEETFIVKPMKKK